MPDDPIFPNGLIFKAPRGNAPDFVKGSLSIRCADFVQFLREHVKDGWVNIDLKENRDGKYYCQLNTWSPDGGERSSPPPRAEPRAEPSRSRKPDDDIPFAPEVR